MGARLSHDLVAAVRRGTVRPGDAAELAGVSVSAVYAARRGAAHTRVRARPVPVRARVRVGLSDAVRAALAVAGRSGATTQEIVAAVAGDERPSRALRRAVCGALRSIERQGGAVHVSLGLWRAARTARSRAGAAARAI